MENRLGVLPRVAKTTGPFDSMVFSFHFLPFYMRGKYASLGKHGDGVWYDI
jgi:hypothetical protein